MTTPLPGSYAVYSVTQDEIRQLQIQLQDAESRVTQTQVLKNRVESEGSSLLDDNSRLNQEVLTLQRQLDRVCVYMGGWVN